MRRDESDDKLPSAHGQVGPRGSGGVAKVSSQYGRSSGQANFCVTTGSGSCTEEVTAHEISSEYMSGQSSDLAGACLGKAGHEEDTSMVSATTAS